MALQLAKINKAWVVLTNTSMGITDIQYSLILLNALPASYKVLASTILASGGPKILNMTRLSLMLSMKKVTGPAPPTHPSTQLMLHRSNLPKARRRKIMLILRATTVIKRGTSSLIAGRKRKMRRRRKRRKHYRPTLGINQQIVMYRKLELCR